RVGFDWPTGDGALDKVREEFEELVAEIHPDEAPGEKERRVFEEMGDLLFALVNVSRFLKVQPEEALQAACEKFMRRFRHIETRSAQTGRSLEDMTLQEMDVFWDEAKKLEKEEPEG
ncbi:nucleoside triphosphate pyrophosphohydrolase, partial [bacterium]|nr:nucleoside triphosphate pyrophosphohydrolase [bacterium]